MLKTFSNSLSSLIRKQKNYLQCLRMKRQQRTYGDKQSVQPRGGRGEGLVRHICMYIMPRMLTVEVENTLGLN